MMRVVNVRSEPVLHNHVAMQGQAHGITMAHPRCGQLALIFQLEGMTAAPEARP
jgi:hypothetical protein